MCSPWIQAHSDLHVKKIYGGNKGSQSQAAKVISQRKRTALGMTDKIGAVYLKDNNRTE